MARKRHSPESIAAVLRKAESGIPLAKLAREAGVHENTILLWKKKYGQLGTPEISSNNPIEHLNKEIRRRTRSIGIFPSPESALRLITMILVEQSEDWMTERRYMTPESLELVLQA